MRFSRMPEIRRSGNLPLFGLATVVVLVAAALIFYFTIGFGANFQPGGLASRLGRFEQHEPGGFQSGGGRSRRRRWPRWLQLLYPSRH